MLPALHPEASVAADYQQFLTALKGAGFRGDIETRYGHRINYATDNSIYQLLPQAIISPKTVADLQVALQLASSSVQYQQLSFSPRGGGTGTNGQALNTGIIVDTARYLTKVDVVEPSAKTAVVQCGVIKDALNDELRPHGLFFSPDLSTSNRATIGGMISTDASGAGSLVYGKTSDHVLGITAVLDDGSLLETAPWDAEARAKLTGRGRQLAQDILALCQQKQEQIESRFPKLNRFLTGYDLKHCYDPQTDILDLTRLLCGAEGTLGFVVAARLDLTDIPVQRVLVNIQYDSFDSALRDAPSLVEANATVVETIDATVLGLAKQDIIWHNVAALVEPEQTDSRFDGINMVEFAGSEEDVAAGVDALLARLDTKPSSILGYKVCRDLVSIGRVYGMRKKAVGLLAAAKGSRKPIAFAEDTAVPPEKLADFIAEFRTILDREKLNYGMFGHVDAGVLHVRPALDMADPADEQLLYRLSDEVAALTQKYGGLMWGEHGRGIRSKYGPDVFGELFDDLRQIKAWFDPHNKLNPGKICTPLGSDDQLLPLQTKSRGAFNRQISPHSREEYERAIRCNGNGLCFNYQKQSPMCPSYMASGDRVESPKGRADLMREWLRLLAEQGIDLSQYPPKPASVWERTKNSYRNGDDFSHEVYAGMQSCLACKACSGACPVKVDIPTLRAEFLHHYYGRYLRPAKDYLVAGLEDTLPLQSKMPKLVNALSQNAIAVSVIKLLFGYVDAPALSVPTLQQRAPSQPQSIKQLEQQLHRLNEQERANTVLLVQDPFTSHYDALVVEQALHLLSKLGFNAILVPYLAHGKPQHIKGFTNLFKKTATRTTEVLNRLTTYGVPMVGIDPAMVLTYQDEYVESLGIKAIKFEVQLLAPFLLSHLSRWQAVPTSGKKFRLMGHCTESSVRPQGAAEWQKLMSHFGAELNLVSVGCCGMAGTYGHEVANLEISKQLYQMHWSGPLYQGDGEALVSGYSCRSQVKRLDKRQMRHPLQALLDLVE
ncbi:FAD-binding and (Fe-S)-binding domain-containing protein [Ferrimonas lipolytica]|uniref:D-2-hydroxyglutarate dehydrogenase n=1 Tax=Ferrimonas lipolytica TaxID=2724191 RepID=A0A6H1UBG9_9GAMM|nr:FAD-binding and (Fe-S)-binding domain-containing protein [Ferrimonas lipolytica]QIZ76405.1 FAD-binding oxidoreductase [Ferrimonas lipolytica]